MRVCCFVSTVYLHIGYPYILAHSVQVFLIYFEFFVECTWCVPITGEKELNRRQDNKRKKMTSDQSQQFNQDQDASATKQNRDFTCGVVEGFYGRPWTTEQRKDLFRK